MKSPIVLTMKVKEALVEEVLGMSGLGWGERRPGIKHSCTSRFEEDSLAKQKMLMLIKARQASTLHIAAVTPCCFNMLVVRSL